MNRHSIITPEWLEAHNACYFRLLASPEQRALLRWLGKGRALEDVFTNSDVPVCDLEWVMRKVDKDLFNEVAVRAFDLFGPLPYDAWVMILASTFLMALDPPCAA